MENKPSVRIVLRIPQERAISLQSNPNNEYLPYDPISARDPISRQLLIAERNVLFASVIAFLVEEMAALLIDLELLSYIKNLGMESFAIEPTAEFSDLSGELVITLMVSDDYREDVAIPVDLVDDYIVSGSHLS